MMIKTGKLFVISAPSGGGKTTLAHAVIEQLRPIIELKKVITYTSRPSRTTEQDGIDYHFITRNEFINKIKAGFFLETTEYNGHYYGSPVYISDDMKAGKSFIIVTDPPGAKTMSEVIAEAVLIWLIPPSLQVLEERIKGRGTESLTEIAQRLAIAHKELANEEQEHLFKYTVINDQLDQATNELCTIIKHELAID